MGWQFFKTFKNLKFIKKWNLLIIYQSFIFKIILNIEYLIYF